MTNYMRGRWNPIASRSVDECEADLAAIAAAVGEGWLGKEAGGNSLKRLWARDDSLSTSQLLTLGHALRELGPLYPGWMRHQVKALKAGKGERRGAILELIALQAFRDAGHDAHPTPKNHPGYDIALSVADASVDISVKNFGASEHEASARRAWDELLDTYQAERALAPHRAAGLFVEAARYPSADDWKDIKAGLRELVQTPWDGNPLEGAVGSCWRLLQHPLPTKYGPFAGASPSYQLVTVIPHHKNEHANLISYLEAASANARKHARGDKNVARALLIRIRETAALEVYRDWAADYLSENDGGPLDAVLLYQPTMAFTEQGAHALHHAFVAVFGPSYLAWSGGRTDRQLRMQVPIGLMGGPVDRQLQFGEERLPIGDRYLFQRGEFFIAFGAEGGSVNLLAPGIHQHAVLSVGEGAGITLSGKFPPGDALELFD